MQVHPLPPNTIGEVLVAGAGVAAGYLDTGSSYTSTGLPHSGEMKQ